MSEVKRCQEPIIRISSSIVYSSSPWDDLIEPLFLSFSKGGEKVSGTDYSDLVVNCVF